MPRLNKTEAGLIVVSDPDADKPILEMKTLQCVHCQKHWVPQPGSGRIRGWCMNCNGPVCGPSCADCVPAQQMLDNIEKGRPENFKPTQVFVPHNFE